MESIALPAAPLVLPAAIVVASVTFAVVAAVLRSARSSGRKTVVGMLNLVFAIGLVAFAFPPLHDGVDRPLTLLTDGATGAQRARALRAPDAFAMTDVALSDRERDRIRVIEDLRSLRRQRPAAGELTVLGAGLDADAWRESPTWAVDFSPAPALAGVRYAHWPRRLDAGETLTVSGALVASGEEARRVSLLEPSGDVAATTLTPPGEAFRLQGRTRAYGRYLFQLQVEGEDGGVIEIVPLPVQVVAPSAASVLMLLSAPSFESRAVKDWARRGSSELAVRTTVSRDRHREEFINRDALSLQRIDPALLSHFDLLIADGRAWFALTRQQRETISRQVADEGLGVLLIVVEATDTSDALLPFPALQTRVARSAALEIDGADPAAMTVALAAATFAGGAQSLVTDLSGDAVAAFAQHGRGRLGITLVTDSHRLVTAGQMDLYARYWQALVAGLAPPRIEARVETRPEFPVPGQRVQVCARGDALPAEADLLYDSAEPIRIELRAHPLKPGERCGYLWPTRAGWHELRLDEQKTPFYVFAGDAWRARRAADKTAATRLQAAGGAAAERREKPAPRPLPRWWFAMVILATAAALWLEQRSHETAPGGTGD